MSESYALHRGGFVLIRTREPTVGIGFREPFDSLLRRLDARYVRAAWAGLAGALAEFGLDPNTCHWGECHPGLLVAIDGSSREESPISGTGWLLTESDVGPLVATDDFVAPWPGLDEVFADLDPPLIVLYDHHRARRATRHGEPIHSSDTATGFECLLAMVAEDHTDWRGRSTPADVPWMRAANAIAAGDATALADALTDVHEQYTPAGARLCLEGFGSFLLQWTIASWTPSD